MLGGAEYRGGGLTRVVSDVNLSLLRYLLLLYSSQPPPPRGGGGGGQRSAGGGGGGALHFYLLYTWKGAAPAGALPPRLLREARPCVTKLSGALPPEGAMCDTSMIASCNARQRNRRGNSPQTPRGETPQKGGNSPRGNPTRQHTPHRGSSRRGPRCNDWRRRSNDPRTSA